MLMEECIELALGIRKFSQRQPTEERYENVLEEIADVEIMIEQFKFNHPNSEERIEKYKELKLKRLQERIST